MLHLLLHLKTTNDICQSFSSNAIYCTLANNIKQLFNIMLIFGNNQYLGEKQLYFSSSFKKTYGGR